MGSPSHGTRAKIVWTLIPTFLTVISGISGWALLESRGRAGDADRESDAQQFS